MMIMMIGEWHCDHGCGSMVGDDRVGICCVCLSSLCDVYSVCLFFCAQTLSFCGVQCLLSSPALDGGADPRKKFIGKNSKTP